MLYQVHLDMSGTWTHNISVDRLIVNPTTMATINIE
jgi:hypothetical protein